MNFKKLIWKGGGLTMLGLFFAISFAQGAHAAAFTASVTGNWNSGATWGNPGNNVAGSGYPTTGDSATIASGVTVTATANANATTLTLAAAAASNGLTINSGVTVTLSSSVSISTPTATADSVIDVGDGSLLATGSIGMTGSATAGRNTILRVHDGTISGSTFSFSGVSAAAQQQFISTGNSTFTLTGSGGNFGTSNVGTVTTNGTGTIVINGSGSAITLGNYTYNNVTINTSTTINTTTVGGTLTLNGGTASVGALTVNGQTILNGGTLFGNSGSKRFDGLVTVNSGTWSDANGTGWEFRGGITVNGGTFASNNSTAHNFTTNDQTLGGSQAFTVGNAVVTGITVANASTAGLTFDGLSGTGSTTQMTNAVMNILGTNTVTNFFATSTGNTVNYNGTTQTVKAATYYNLTLSNSSTKTLTGVTTVTNDLTTSGTAAGTTAANFTIGGNLTIGSGSTLTVGGFDFTVSGTTSVTGTHAHSSSSGTKIYTGAVTVNSGGTWTNAGNSAFTFRGGLTHNGTTFTSGSGVYTFDTNDQSIGGSSALTISSITATGVTLTNTSTVGLTVSTALAGSGTFKQDPSTLLNIGATSVAITAFDATASSNVVNYNSSTFQAIYPTTYVTLKSNNTSSTGAFLNGATTLKTLTIGDVSASSKFADIGYTLSLSASSVLNLTQGTYKLGTTSTATTFPAFGTYNIAANTTVEYAAAVAQSISGAPSYANINFTSASTKTAAAGLTVGGTFTVSAGTVDLSTFTHSVVGNILVTGATLALNSSTLSVQSNFSGGVGASVTSSGASTVKFTGGNAQSLNVGTSNTFTFGSMSVEKTTGTSVAPANGSLVINNDLNVVTGILSFSSTGVLVSGITTVSDTVQATTNTSSRTFVSLVTINNGAVWDLSTGNPAMIFRGGLTNNSSSFTAGSGVYTFNTNSQVIGGTSAISIPSMTVTGVTLTNNSSVGLTVGTALSGTGGLTQGTNAVLNITGTSGITTLTATGSGNTVNYNGAAQTVKATTYNNLTLSGSGTKTLTSLATINNDFTLSGTAAGTTAAALAVGGNLSVGTGSSLTVAGFNFSVAGTTSLTGTLDHSSSSGTKTYTGLLTLNSGGVWTNTGSSAITFRGGITNNGTTFTAGSGVYTFDTNSQAINGSTALSIPSVTVTGVTLTNNQSLTIGTALSGTGGFTNAATGSLYLGGTSGITTLTASASGNTVTYNSTAAGQTVNSTTYHHLTIDKSGQTATLGGPIIVNGNLTITSGTLDASGSNYGITAKGDWTNGGTFTARSGAVTFSGTGTQTINNANNWYGLAITASSARTVRFQSSVAQSIAANGSLTLTGASGQKLTLAPLTPATEWQLHIDPSGVTQNITNVNVSYSNAGPSPTYATANGDGVTNTNGGNNTNWSFVVPDSTPPSVTLDSPTNGQTVQGASVSLAATATDDTAVAGVKFYIDGALIGAEDTSSAYTGTLDSTGFSNGSHTLVAAARDTSGNFATSTNVTITIDNTVLAITSISATPSNTTATVTWTTNRTASSSIQYGTSISYGSASSSDSFVTSHSLTLTGLSPSTLYHYKVFSTDTFGNASSTNDLTFTTTAAPDVTAPSVTLYTPTNGQTIQGTSVSLTATASDNVAVAGVKFYIDGTLIGSEDTTPAYSGTLDSTGFPDGSHSIVAAARDTSGNFATSTAATITIDNATLSVTSVAVTPSLSTALITWTTNRTATSTVQYGTSISYGSASSSDVFVTSHSITLTGLSASTVYHYKVLSRDSFDNIAQSTDATFATTATPDTTPPTMTLSSTATSPVTGVFTVDAVTDEAVSGFTLGDINVTNGTAGTFVTTDSSHYSFTITPSGSGTISISVPAGVFQDGSSNVNTAPSNSLSYSQPGVTPTPTPTMDTSYRTSSGSGLISTSEIPAELKALYRTSPEQNSVKGVEPITFKRNLETNMTGDDVKALQVFLNTHGYIITKSGPGASGSETNKFGALTRLALSKFQKANKISPAAGYFGPATRAFVNKLLAK